MADDLQDLYAYEPSSHHHGATEGAAEVLVEPRPSARVADDPPTTRAPAGARTAARAGATHANRLTAAPAAKLAATSRAARMRAARTAHRARRTWIALLFFPIFAIYLVIDAIRDLSDLIGRARHTELERRPQFHRPQGMPPPEGRTMEDIVATIESFPFDPLRIPTQLAFFRDNGPDALGSLLSGNPNMTTIPHTYPRPFRERLFSGFDGSQLAGMQAMHEHVGPAIVLAHGLLMTKNFDIIIQMARRAYESWGFHVITLDLRGWGQSSWTTDAPASAGYFEGRDVVEVCRELHRNDLVTSVGVIGFSLGGASVLNAALVATEADDDPIDGGVLSVSAPTEIGDALRYISEKPHWRHPYFGLYHLFEAVIKGTVRRKGLDRSVRTWYDLVEAMSAPYYGVTMEEFGQRASATTFADRIRLPVLALHAADDFLVPIHHAYHLQEAAEGNPWVHVTVRDSGNHVGFNAVDERWFHSVVRRWLEYWATPGPAEPDPDPIAEDEIS